MLISFALTTPALIAGRKSVTRRHWRSSHAAHFAAGTLVDAWDASPRAKPTRLRIGLPAPRKVATIRITREPYLEMTHWTEVNDFLEREGFRYLDEIYAAAPKPHETWVQFGLAWRAQRDAVYVVEFRLIEVFQ